MKTSNLKLLVIAIGLLSVTQACKTKKVVAKPAPAAVIPPKAQKEIEQTPVEMKATPAPEPVVEKPDFNFKNVQFEFNSDVLKTTSFEVLDKIVMEMKKSDSAKLILNGNSSAEGSVAHNMSLSVDRANAVKSYLVNAGIAGSRITVNGFGATKPLTSNDTEEGRALNRRVEFEVVK